MAVKSAPLHKSRSICREKRYLNKFEGCPYVVRCFRSDTTIEKGEGWYNLFLEYASGGSLFDRIRKSGRGGGGGLPESEARRYTKSILTGLNDVHKQGYVHCDIKPQNILLVESEKEVLLNLNGKRKRVEKPYSAKIADFGVAMKAGKGKKDQGRKLRGTPMYIAPESVRYGEYEAYSDIWALGCTLLHMVTGQVPWKVDKNAALLFRIGFREQVPEIPSDGLSKEARDFLNKCLVRDPKSRWTADMLLAHPFVSGLDDVMMGGSIKEERNRVVQPQKTAREVLIDSSSSQSSFDLTKPYLLMSHAASNGIVPDFSKIRIIKRMKRLEEEEEEVKRSESSFRLDARGRYWGIKAIPVIPSSNIAIEIFN
ncbi:hypothetical protein Vadar_021675 [Vaccinium darrowii]|uniref:Uncharacterized protein n=1 Tax=Vaccinium darrowii TaxID=229202 RepID=A0ACB7YNS5_9ERIC|nr:hypothetical protein Vadar_021675 [Vaccinium darrowii]